jgi:hypothetical protein
MGGDPFRTEFWQLWRWYERRCKDVGLRELRLFAQVVSNVRQNIDITLLGEYRLMIRTSIANSIARLAVTG